MQRIAWLLAATCATLVGCVSADVRLGSSAVEPRTTRAARQPGCRLPPVNLVDARPREVLGRIGRYEVTYAELPRSIDAALLRAATRDPDAAPLKIEILRAHLENHPSGHSFNLVLRAHGGDGRTQVFRGLASGVTWWGSEREFGEYVRLAADDAAARLVASHAVCPER